MDMTFPFLTNLSVHTKTPGPGARRRKPLPFPGPDGIKREFFGLFHPQSDPAVLLFILLTVAGLMAFNKTMVQDFPDMDFPVRGCHHRPAGAAP